LTNEKGKDELSAMPWRRKGSGDIVQRVTLIDSRAARCFCGEQYNTSTSSSLSPCRAGQRIIELYQTGHPSYVRNNERISLLKMINFITQTIKPCVYISV
jgi:hypothetical protein